MKNCKFPNLSKRPLLLCFIIGTLLYSFIELIGRHSFDSFGEFLVNDFFAFAYNALIVVLTLSVSLFARRRIFAIALISAAWLTLGVTNCVLLFFRITPLNVSDFRILLDAVSMIRLYLDPIHVVLIVAAFALYGCFLVFVWRRSPKMKTNLVTSVCAVIAISFTVFTLTNIGIESQALNDDFENLGDAYDDSGFVYGFTRTVLDRGIAQPDNYSEENMDGIYSAIKDSEVSGGFAADADVIMVQLESSFDMTRLNSIELSEDPMPFYSMLKQNYSSGLLTVPSIGAGTANTEFEVLTGMTTETFGAAEYPYYSVLSERSCESLAYNLGEYGLHAHAMHNNDGKFYDRDVVYSQLGFDDYTSLEYMKYVEYNAVGWAEDSVLLRTILDALDSTDGKDFVFAVTVAAHGAYPEDVEPDGDVVVSGIDDPLLAAKYNYYANELRKVDNFIGALYSALLERGEKFVIVLYGDHLPTLDITEDELDVGSLYQTEYVICDNFGLEKSDDDIPAYFLSSMLCEKLGVDSGVVNRLNRLVRGCDFTSTTYIDTMTLIQYDMLYGDELYRGHVELEPSDEFHMSIYPVSVSGAYYYFTDDDESGDSLYVMGDGFTEYSKVIVDGKEYDTDYISDSMLRVDDITLYNLGATVEVGQFTEKEQLLSTSNAASIEVGK